MTLAGLFEWLGQMPVGVFMQTSTYAFPVAEMVHLLSLAILGGAILLIDLRVFGLGLKSQQTTSLALELQPYLIAALCGSIVSGILLVAGEPMKCYYNTAFRLKMLFLALAIIFYFGIQQRHLTSRFAAGLSLVLWLAVGLSGRAIGVL